MNGRGEDYLDQLVQEGDANEAIQAYEEAITEATLAWNPRYDRRLDRRLSRVKAPTMIIGVDDDRVVHTEMAERFASLIPGAEFVRLSDPNAPTSHLVHLEKPQELAGLIAQHISSNLEAHA